MRLIKGATILIRILRTQWKNALLIMMLIAMVFMTGFLLKIDAEKDRLQSQVDKSLTSGMQLALSGLNFDYTKLNNNERIYHYSRIIANLEVAKELAAFTPYENRNKLSNTLEHLNKFMVNRYSSGFKFELGTQVDLYNYLHAVMQNPSDESAVNALNEFIKTIE